MGVLGIITAGGPAPGMNAVIASIVRSAESLGWECIGISEGFRDLGRKDFCKDHWLDHGELQHNLRFADALAGCILGTSRKKVYPEDYPVVAQNLDRIGVDKMVTIGGDGTATGAYHCFNEISIPFMHVPKTIDNDVFLPGNWATFGFWSAVEDGATKIRSLSLDATSCKNRYYFITTQGRNAGHLALEVGFAGGTDIVIIPEMFEDGVTFEKISRVVAGAILSRLSKGFSSGVAVFSEGLLSKVVRNMTNTEIERLEQLVGHEFIRDDHGYIRQSDVDTGEIIAKNVAEIIENHPAFDSTFSDKLRLSANRAGYSMRCAPPTAFDLSYCYQLGSHAVNCLATGLSGEIVCIQNKRFTSIPIVSLINEKQGAIEQNLVNIEDSNFQTMVQQSALLIEDHNKALWKRVMSYTGLPYGQLAEFALTLPKKPINAVNENNVVAAER